MAATLVQSNSGTAATASVSPALSAASTTGNTVVLRFAADDYNGTPDSGWTQSTGMEQQFFHGSYLWWRISAGETTFAYTIGSATNSAWTLEEWSGLTSTPYDTSAGTGNNDSTNTQTTPSITPSSGERLLLASFGVSLASGTPSIPGSFTNSFTASASVASSNTGTNEGVAGAYLEVTADGSTGYSTGASWTGGGSQSRTALIIALNVAGAGGTPGPPLYVARSNIRLG